MNEGWTESDICFDIVHIFHNIPTIHCISFTFHVTDQYKVKWKEITFLMYSVVSKKALGSNPGEKPLCVGSPQILRLSPKLV